MGWIGRGVEWFLQRQELASARTLRTQSSAWQQTCQQRAKTCLALADFLRDSPRFSGDILPEIVALYRSACVWLLAGAADTPRPISTLLEEADHARLLKAAGHQAAVDAVRTVLLRTTFEDASLDRKQLKDDALLLHTFGHSARRFWDGAYAVRWFWWRRIARLALLAPAVVLIYLFVAGNWHALTRYFPQGAKPSGAVAWQASSTYPNCDLAHHVCGSRHSDLLFHTLEEDSPWVEFDLGQIKPITRVDVKNIDEVDLQERAVPLLVEVSMNRSDWFLVAQRDTPFDTWTATFPSTMARFVRLRVARRTYFHLDNVSIR